MVILERERKNFIAKSFGGILIQFFTMYIYFNTTNNKV